MEHVVSYPDCYSPAFAFSAIPCPLSLRTLCSSQTPEAHTAGEDNEFTEFHDDDTVGWVLPVYRRYCVSVARRGNQVTRPLAVLAQAHTATFACQK